MKTRLRIPQVQRLGALAVLWILLAATALPRQQGDAGAGEPQAAADDAQEAPAEDRLKPEDLEAEVQALEARTDLDEDVQSQALEALRQALDSLRRAGELRKQAADLDDRAEKAPEDAEAIRQELAQPPPEPEIAVPEDADLKAIESERDTAVTAAAAAAEKVKDLQTERARRESRLKDLPGEIEAAKKSVSEAREALAVSAPAGQDALVTAATQKLAKARLEQAEAELAKPSSEQSSYKACSDLSQLKIDQAKRAAGTAEAEAEAWQQRASEARRSEAEREARQARLRAQQAATGRWETLGKVASETEELTQERTGKGGLNERRDEADKEKKRLAGELERVRLGYLQAQGRMRVAGENYTMGLLLRRESGSLPPVRDLSRAETARRREISQAEYRRILLEERRDQVGDPGARVKQFLGEVDADPDATAMSADERAKLEEFASQLFSSEKKLLSEMGKEYASYSAVLVETQQDSEELRAVTDAFDDFIAERVLWIRSIAREKVFDYSGTWPGFLWLVGLDPQAGAASLLASFARDHAAALALLAALSVALVLLARWCRRRLAKLAPEVSRYRTDSYWYTVEAVFLTLAIALPLPAVLWLLVAIGHEEVHAGTWLSAWLGALGGLAPFLFAFLSLRAAALPRGLGEAHFRWRAEAVAGLRKELGWFIPVAVLLAIPRAVLEPQDESTWMDSLGRLSFLLGSAVTAAFAARLFRPGGQVLAGYYQRNPDSLVHRLRYVILLIAVALPAEDFVAALFGWFYTARQLREVLAWTGVMVMCLVLAYNLGLRWLYLARRRLAVNEAMQKKAEREAQAKQDQEQEQAQEPILQEPVVDADQVDIPAMDAQTKTLFRAGAITAAVLGMFSVWGSIVPSLRYLDRLQVFPTFALLEEAQGLNLDFLPGAGTGASDQGTEDTAAKENAVASSPPPMSPMAAAQSVAESDEPAIETEQISVSVADLGLSLLFLVLTILGARNIPGLLEIAVLRRLPMDAGERYAAITITRYMIVIVGVTLTLGAIHVTWDTVKWLAAALTFGLAFGLQEIFANFVSGLIVLLERPIRVGDTVTVGTTTGTVSRIRMRATTVVDWNNRELVVPNKNFITNEIINWTLTNTIRRVDFPVGIAYGSDTHKARELLEAAATQSPFVLDDPKPYALFKGFGSSSLDFELRVYIPSGAVWIDLMNDVHTRVDEAFREQGIEIAFPQLDLHLRSAEAAVRVGLEPTGELSAASAGARA